MAKAIYVKRARKDNSAVNAGESYWWWKFRFGGKHYSANKPSRSQLTGSEFLSTVYDIQDTLDFTAACDHDELQEAVEHCVEQLNELLDQVQGSLENMPEHLQESSNAGQTLQERIDNLEEWIGELESAGVDEEDGEVEDLAEELNCITTNYDF